MASPCSSPGLEVRLHRIVKLGCSSGSASVRLGRPRMTEESRRCPGVGGRSATWTCAIGVLDYTRSSSSAVSSGSVAASHVGKHNASDECQVHADGRNTAAAQHADVGEEISSDLAHDRRMRSDRLCGISGTRGRRMVRDTCTVCCSRTFVEEGAMM